MDTRRNKVPLRKLLGSLVVVGVCAGAAWSARPDSPGESEDLWSDWGDASVATVVTWDIPLDVNAGVHKWIGRFLGEQKPYFEKWLTREARYGELIRSRLRERGMPEDLSYMAMIESGFSPRALSRADASGIWQFVDGTARDYGLRVGYWVDERRDPVRATDAALDYLEVLYDRFGSWYLAAAAYNAGENRVQRILRAKAGGRTGDEQLYWEILDHLPRETREYVPRMIAAAIVAKQPARFGLEFERLEPYEFDRVFVPGETSLARVAKGAGIPLSVLRTLNPHILRGVTPPGIAYPVRVPPGSAAVTVAALDRKGARLGLVD